MAHIISDKQKLLNRIRRIRGQVDGIERALEEDQDCVQTLQTLVACHGALKGLMAEIIQDHIRHHVVEPGHKPTTRQSKAAEELIEVVNSYLI